MTAADGEVTCGCYQPMHEIACDACHGDGFIHRFDHDPDWCPECGGCGLDFVPAHPIGEAQA